MTRLKGTQMTLNGILAVDFSKFEVDEDVTTVDGGDPRDPEASLIPSFYYSRQFRENWNFGVSLNVPTGFGATAGPNWAGRYYSDRSSLVYIALSPALAYKLSDSLSVGASVRIMYADSEVHTRVNNNIIGDRFNDGMLSVEAEGVGYGAGISLLYSFSPDTRVGLTWNSQVNIDIDSEIDFRDVRLPAEVIDRLQSQTIDLADNIPMTAGFGVYHRLENDWELTWDLAWVEFSKFGVTEISLEGGNLNTPKGIYNDFFATSIGASWPINAKMRGAVGLLWVEAPMNNDVRTFGISMDESGESERGLPTNWTTVTTWPLAWTYSIRGKPLSTPGLRSPGGALLVNSRITTHCLSTSPITGTGVNRGANETMTSSMTCSRCNTSLNTYGVAVPAAFTS